MKRSLLFLDGDGPLVPFGGPVKEYTDVGLPSLPVLAWLETN